MLKEINDLGICNTCIYRSKCLSMKKILKEGKYIFDCEEFNNSEFTDDNESTRLLNTFAVLPCFSLKNLIP